MNKSLHPKPATDHGAFDGIRLAAAFAVLFSHCYPLTGQEGNEPLIRLTHGGVGFGSAAVFIFFAISGYLVTQSWFRDPSAQRFMMRRLLRIIPALVFVVAASAVLVGGLTTQLSSAAYFSHPETWRYLTKVFVYPAQYGLPGVFTDNPYPVVVNGSLWSLRPEVFLYAVVAFLGWAGVLRFRLLSVACALISLAADAIITHTDVLSRFAFLHQVTVFLENAVPFFVGAALAQTNLASKKLWSLTAAIGAATIALVGTPAFSPLLLLSLPIGTILLARFGRCDLSRYGDFSYGVYLWGFVMQQVCLHYFPSITPAALFFLAGVCTLVMAFISWHLIEVHALKFKPRRKAKVGGLPVAPTAEQAT